MTASCHRSAPAQMRASTSAARPPTQTAAAATCATSATSARPPGDAGVARQRRRHEQQRRRGERGRASAAGSACRGQAGSQTHDRERGLERPDLAEPCPQHRRDDVPAERLAEPEACPRRLPAARSRRERRARAQRRAPASRPESLARVRADARPRPTSSISVPPATSRRSRKSSARTTENNTVTDRGVPSSSTCAAMPAGFAPGAPTWKTNAPETGCASADTARQVAV